MSHIYKGEGAWVLVSDGVVVWDKVYKHRGHAVRSIKNVQPLYPNVTVKNLNEEVLWV